MMSWFPVLLVGFMTAMWIVSVSPFLPLAVRVDPTFVFAIAWLMAKKRKQAFLTTAVVALIVGAYPLDAPPFLFVRWMIAVLVADALLRHLLTNRSLYACVTLVLAARSTDMLLGRLIIAVGGWFGISGVSTSRTPFLWTGILLEALLAAMVFFVLFKWTHDRVSHADRRGQLV